MADVNIVGYGVNPSFDSGAPITRIRIVDMAEATAKKGSALAQNDVIKVFGIKKGETVKSVTCRIITAGTALTTIALGRVSSTSGYMAASALDATAGTTYLGTGALLYTLTEGVPNVLSGKADYFAADGTLDILLPAATAVTSGVVEITAEIIPAK